MPGQDLSLATRPGKAERPFCGGEATQSISGVPVCPQSSEKVVIVPQLSGVLSCCVWIFLETLGVSLLVFGSLYRFKR